VIARKIYNIDEPLFQGYEFIGIKGLTGKMSGSSGLNINLEELLKIYPPEIIWWLYARKTPNEAFDISLGDDVPRIYGNLTDFVKTITITPKIWMKSLKAQWMLYWTEFPENPIRLLTFL